MQEKSQTEIVTLAGGCFWCLEAVFDRLRGVVAVEPGYSNGEGPSPSYEQVCTGRTGYAEVVRIEFDPAQLSLHQVFEVFFCIHDPTSLNRQGADVGTQYRSGMYCHSQEQVDQARVFIQQAQPNYPVPIVTEVACVQNYAPAEDYHRHYFRRNPDQGYCVFVVAAKVDKFLATFKNLVRHEN